MRKTYRTARLLGRAGVGVLLLGGAAAADDLYYQGPTDGTGVWNSNAQAYYSWYDVQTGIQHRDFPLNGDFAYLQQASAHGVSNTTVNFNDLYVTPGLNQLTISSGNTLLQSTAGTAMYTQTAELGFGGTSGTYTMTAGTATITTLRLGAEPGSQGVFNLSVGTLQTSGEQIGFNGLGDFLQRSGQNNCPEMFLGDQAGGHYRLEGGGISSHEQLIGYLSTGIFEQVGGVNSTDRLLLGSSSTTGNGSYSLAGGTLAVGSTFTVGPLGTFTAQGGILSGGPAASPATLAISPASRFLISGETSIANSFLLTFGSAIQLQNGLDFNSASMTLQGGSIGGVGTVRVDSASTLRGAGQITVPSSQMFNNGSILADGGTFLITATTLNTVGTLRAFSGSSLIVQTTNPVTNNGTIQSDAGGSVAFSAPLTNGAGSLLALSGGTLAAPTVTNAAGGNVTGLGAIDANLVNSGAIGLIGPTQVIGSLTNNSTAVINVRNSQLLVTGSGTNTGAITTSSGGSVAFNGGLTGNPVGAAFTGAVTVQASGSLVANYVRQSSVSIGGVPGDPTSYPTVTLRRRSEGGQPSTVSTLSIASGGGSPAGRVDLADNSLTIAFGAGLSPDPLVRSYLTAGYAHGTWSGFGITSSVAALDPAHFALGYAAGADQVVTGLPSDQELIRFTRVGDVNLDGLVGFPDLLALAQHYGQFAARWDEGDLNYDGAVNFSDLLLLVQNYGTTSAGIGVEASGTFSAVPEPAAWTILPVALLLPIGRRHSPD